MKNAFSAVFLAVLIAASPARGLAEKFPPCSETVFGFDKAEAYEQYQRRPPSELSKLLYLKDILKESDCAVIYNGKSYDPDSIVTLISAYVRLNYKKEKAENWIAQHAHRSLSKGQVIYLKDTQGRMLVLKDVLIQELRALPA